jgi:hypothetical protein
MIRILDIQNAAIFCIACLSTLVCLYYNFSSLPSEQLVVPFEYMLVLIGIHSAIDIFVQKWDMIIHHTFVLGLCYFYYVYGRVMTPEDGMIIVYPYMKVEISSIFYTLRFWLPKKSPFYTVNSLLFYLTFLKFRIIDNFYDVIINSTFISIITSTTNNVFMISLLYISGCGLYLLNIYWFYLINKMIVQTSFNRSDKVIK